MGGRELHKAPQISKTFVTHRSSQFFSFSGIRIAKYFVSWGRDSQIFSFRVVRIADIFRFVFVVSFVFVSFQIKLALAYY